MSSEFKLEAKVRADVGKGASRRLRRNADLMPAIVYGGSANPENIVIAHKDIVKVLENEAFYTSIVSLSVDGKSERVVLKDLQRHPAKDKILHADFQRVSDNVKIKIRVPLHFINEDKCHGVKMEGGIISHAATEIEVQCLPKFLPEYIEVDMLELSTGDILHISDLKLPEGVESVELLHGADHDQAIANVLTPKGSSEDDEGDAPEADADADTEEGDSEE